MIFTNVNAGYIGVTCPFQKAGNKRKMCINVSKSLKKIFQRQVLRRHIHLVVLDTVFAHLQSLLVGVKQNYDILIADPCPQKTAQVNICIRQRGVFNAQPLLKIMVACIDGCIKTFHISTRCK